MKKAVFHILFLTISFSANSQDFYYVFFTDKNNVDFNPYEYFDAKAIERRVAHGIFLYDSSDFPVNLHYIKQVADLSEEYVGESRWFNMVMISATDENMVAIQRLPFVKNVMPISENFNLRLAKYQDFDIDDFLDSDTATERLSVQLLNLQGEYFLKNNINGKGLRIAVFDGGFPKVDEHEAFEHLRNNHQIIKTWNFPCKKEHVYDYNSHGTMVLSCIAGIKKNGTMLGLATGAEFLLARTEIAAEPKKEEFWWLQAVEWADRNGANIINSSLGYGIDNHDYKEFDGKTTLVTKAANMAAAKGILVCNSAGNEATNKAWLKIIAPADADSVLTVGGINSNLTHLNKISFSSYGPTADGRMKPNVVAFGSATVAKPSENGYRMADGTSFSSPLVAGFTACAWQTDRSLTAMQLKTEIEKSASLYPYFDYAYGYGVPQASYFTEKEKIEKEKTFEITVTDTTIIITPFVEKLDFLEQQHYLFYNIQNENGTLEYYTQINLYDYYTQVNRGKNKDYSIVINKNSILKDKTLNVFLNGYLESYKIEGTEFSKRNISRPYPNVLSVDVKKQTPSKWGYKAKHFMTGYMAYSMFAPTTKYSYFNFAKSHSFDLGIRYKYNVCKWYAVGGNLELGITKYHYNNNRVVYYSQMPFPFSTPKYIKNVMTQFNLEFFQRFRLATNRFGDVYFDLGGYGNVTVSGKNKILYKYEDSNGNVFKTKNINDVHYDLFGYGVKVRFGYGFLAVFAQYDFSNSRFNDLIKLGIELSIKY